MAGEHDKIPTGRVRRLSRVGRVAAGSAIRQAGTRAANVTRSDDKSRDAMERRQIETAERIVAVLGTMKGAAMKVGQVMSFLDVGLVPEDYREEFQRKLAKLRDAAPNVSFKQMRAVIEDDIEEPLREVFSEFDETPIAAASIGQVYRARLRDDEREVAVKVQYPGVAAAVRSDMQNLGLILRLMRRMAPGMDAQEIAAEITARVEEELDYELEASNQRAVARLFRGHPFIVVPGVVTSLCRERVIVTEFVHGTGFEELRKEPQAERDRIGEIIYRFFFGCLYRHGQFSGDPHPGNYLRLPDGRVAFLDFGLFKKMEPRRILLELETGRAFIAGDVQRVFDLFVEMGFVPDPARSDPERVFSHFRDATWWYSEDADLALTPEIATEILIVLSDPRSPYFDQMRHQTMPGEHLFARRMEMLVLAVLAQLGAQANWHRIAREWTFGDPPTTELGRLEAEFYAARPPALVARAV